MRGHGRRVVALLAVVSAAACWIPARRTSPTGSPGFRWREISDLPYVARGDLPGAQAFFEADLTPGGYALLCFVTAPDGRPHVMHGMVKYLHID